MSDLKYLNARYETVAWGGIFLWLGILSIVPGDQSNLFLLGVGVIFLALNWVRSLKGIAINWFSVTIGALALSLGGVSLLWPLTGIKSHFEVGFFPLMMLVIGLYLLIPGPKKEAHN